MAITDIVYNMPWWFGTTDSMDMGLGGTPRVGDGQRCLACCSSWGLKESDTTERLNWTESHVAISWPQLRCGIIYILEFKDLVWKKEY